MLPHSKPGSVDCPDCDRSFGSDLGLEMHQVRVHRQHTPPIAPTEDDSIFAVSLTLPENDWLRVMLGRSREGRVRSVLDSARRKAARNGDVTEEEVVGQFWDDTDRLILQNLRDRGVDILGRQDESVGSEGHGR
jgi:hypothetical protein